MYIKGDSRRDMTMRWGSTLIRVNEGGVDKLVYIREILNLSDRSVELLGDEYSPKAGWIPINKTFPLSRVDTSFPKSGYLNIGRAAYLFSRYPRSGTYYMGLNDRRASIVAPNTAELNTLGIPYKLNVLDAAIHLYDRQHFSVKEAYKKIASGELVSCSVSDNIAFGASYKAPNVAIYRRNKFIGEMIDEKTANIKYSMRYFADELNELGITTELVSGGEKDGNIK